ncbi:unnamed protein product [Phytophthora lilii]|uniref:Unnamed protein product n=1 Tax=Phytophthora lilii TaxID=2077276 RepID=A0A9W6WZZ3_9STRA|nr:unnamed protein product [Phytophthora lilii]
MTADANELKYNDLITLGTFQASKSMALDSSGVGLMLLGTSSTNNLRFYGGTANRETMNIYRVSDTNGLVIASRTTSASNNKTYPLLNLISTDNPSSFVEGVSATSADLFNINWNDKPSVGFTSQTHKVTVSSAGRVGIRTGSPSAILDVSGSVSSTKDIAGSGVAYFLRSGGLVSTIGPLSSIAVSIKASSAMLAGAGFYTTSDKRIKTNIQPIDKSVGDSILDLNPVQYRYKSQGDDVPLQIGYIAQDAIKLGLGSIVNFTDRKD